ncbi:MAG: biotin--[acetyl-CoA-carboxylase] ligase [Chloroflexi bacterium]|nr:biotin--[acetyl-CoA-carboxylase] ligase [Chloroflexota bacterium]
MDSELTHDAVAAALHTQLLGRTLEVYRSIDSTNTRAAALARQGAPDGALVLAEEQTAGRGRLGRSWLAPAGSSLLFSLVLRPNLQPAEMQRLAMITSLAACRAVERLYGLYIAVKWPNDIQFNGRKLGGMLCEAGLEKGNLAWVVVGLGLNVNIDPHTLGELLVPATSLSRELGHEAARLPLLAALLEELEPLYLRVNAGWLPHDAWRERLATLGEQVRVSTPQEASEGLAEDVDANGALLLRLADGSRRTILAGDVTLRTE